MPCRSAGDPTGAPDSQDDVIEIGLLVLDEFSPDVSRRGRTRIEKPISHRNRKNQIENQLKFDFLKLFEL
jgi:hypothetical protein